MGMKRSGAGEGKKGASAQAVPTDILVQRMSSTASGRLKKFEPLDTRDFVPFGDYDDLTIANIKGACEKYYQAPEGSCDILASDRGPSCTKLEQIKGKKVYFIRFLPPKSTDVAPKLGQQLFEDSLAPAKVTMSVPSPMKTSGNLPALHSMVFPKSMSVTDLLKAGKLVKPQAANITVLDLESFDVAEMKWVKSGSLTLEIETRLAHGAFRDVFRATTIGKDAAQTAWVVKRYQEEAAKTIKDDLSMSLEDHKRKQGQMSAVSRHLTKRFAKNVPPEFGGEFKSKHSCNKYCDMMSLKVFDENGI